MNNKEYFKKFFSNSAYGLVGWFMFNGLFMLTYIVICDALSPYIWEEHPENLIYKCIIPFAIVYIVALAIVFLIGYFCMKDTGNVLSNMVSIFVFRGLEMIMLAIPVVFFYYDNHILPFVNWSIETLNYIFVVIYGFHLDFEFTPAWYFLTSIIPFVIMFIGFQIGKRRRNKKNVLLEKI